jgi:membrane dipeptidase
VHWIDGHLDLAYLAVQGRDLRRRVDDDDACVSLPALRDAPVTLAMATIFTAPGRSDDPACYRDSDDVEAAEAAGRRQLAVYERLESEGALSIVRTAGDLERRDHVLRVILLMEGADPIRGPERVPWWFDRGLRLVGLTWSSGTRYAGGNAHAGPLTPRGIDLVAALDEVGIIHDASHLCDAALEGLLAHTSGPVVATHSNCRALVADDERHLRDDQIGAIVDRGGVIGLNLHRPFLTARGPACIDDCIRHVTRLTEIAGHRRSVALGSDMDGGFGTSDLPVDLDAPAHLPRLADALRRHGWSEPEVRGFAHDNWMTFLRRELRA